MAVSALSLGRSLTQPKGYQAASALLFRDQQLAAKFFGTTPFTPTQDPLVEAATNLQLVSLPEIARLTATSLQAHGIDLTASAVQGSVSIAQGGQSNVVTITATQPNPARAAALANAYAQTYIAFNRQNDQAQVAQAQAIVAQQISALPPNSAQARSLTSQNDQLTILKSLQTGNAELVETANPPQQPSSPRPRRAALLGVLLGALVGCILIFVLERLDRRIRDPSEIKEIFGRPILAAVAIDPNLSASNANQQARMGSLEPFRILRANLAFFNIGSLRRSIVITSSLPGDGKTTVARNLALVAAAAGQRVLVLEADLRRPRLAEYLGLSHVLGLSEILSMQASIDDAIRPYPQVETTSLGEHAALDVLLSGAPPPNPAELIGSGAMESLLDELESRYDLVVIDTPPITVVSDALLLIQRTKAVVLVARLHFTTRDAAVLLRDQLATLEVEPLGVVVNATRTTDAGYSYYYSAGYGGGPPVNHAASSATQTVAADAGPPSGGR